MVGRGSSPRHAVVARVVRTDPSAHAFPAALQPAPHTRAVAAIHVAELDLLIARKSNLRHFQWRRQRSSQQFEMVHSLQTERSFFGKMPDPVPVGYRRIAAQLADAVDK